jgi:hypothetical protein
MAYEVRMPPCLRPARRAVGLAPPQAPVAAPVAGSDNASEGADHAEIEDRRRTFQAQIAVAGRSIPVLCYRPEVPVQPAHCTSCGDLLIDGAGSFGRCGRCGEAARQALMRR